MIKNCLECAYVELNPYGKEGYGHHCNFYGVKIQKEEELVEINRPEFCKYEDED